MKTTLIALLALCLPLAGADKKKPGTPIWEFQTGGDVYSSPAIGSDGTVHVGSGDFTVLVKGCCTKITVMI